MSRKAELALIRKAQAGDKAAMSELIYQQKGYVKHWATRHWRRYGGDLDELIQAGRIAVMRAVQKFNTKSGLSLCTYAAWWCGAAMKDATFTRSRRQQRTFATLDESIADNRYSGRGEALSRKDVLVDEAPTPEEALLAADELRHQREVVRKALAKLRPMWREVLERRLLHGETQGAIGDSLGRTKQAICQAERRGIKHFMKAVEAIRAKEAA